MKFSALTACLSLALFSCSSSSPSAPQALAPEGGAILGEEPGASARSEPDAEAPHRPLALQEYFKTIVAGDPAISAAKDGVADERDPNYLTVSSRELGNVTLTYRLFRGQDRDLVVQEKKRCAPGCTYMYSAYAFKGPKPQKLLLSSLLPMTALDKQLRHMLPQPKRRQHFVQGWPRPEHLRLVLKAGAPNPPLYALREVTSKKREDVSYYDVGALRWNEGDFAFQFQSRGKAKSLGKLDAY